MCSQDDLSKFGTIKSKWHLFLIFCQKQYITYPAVQCAAVRTQEGLMRLPPQNQVSFKLSPKEKEKKNNLGFKLLYFPQIYFKKKPKA